MYVDKLDDLGNKYNTYSTIKMKPADVESSTYIDFKKESNIFVKGYTPSWSEEFFMIKKVKKLKILCHGHVSLVIVTAKKLLKRFTKENYKNQIKNS